MRLSEPYNCLAITITRQTLRYHAAASRVYTDTWTVVDIFTGLPIVIGGIVMDCLSAEQVNEMVDELNYENLDIRGMPRPDP